MKIKTILFFIVSALFIISSCDKSELFSPNKKVKYLFLYTNDEHGHILEKNNYYKSIALYEMWLEEEAKCKDCNIFKISGGDNYTGSAISSVFKGESTANVLKMIGYELSAVGNHEFDYGIDSFNKNRHISGIDYLSANIIGADMKPQFTPSRIIERGGKKVGFAGITTEELKQVSASSYMSSIMVVKSLNSADREITKTGENSDMVVALTHQSYEESKDWVFQLKKKPLIVFNAHTHDEYIKNVEDTYFVQTGKYLNKYARIEVVCENAVCAVSKAEIVSIKKNTTNSTPGAKKIAKLIDDFQGKMERVAGMKISKAGKDTSEKDFRKLYNCSNLIEFPDADLSLCNPGAFREELKKGDIKKSDIISVLPFENRIVISELKGSDLIYNLELSENSYCGAEKKGDIWYVGREKIDNNKVYKAIINDFMHNGGDKYKFIGNDFKNSITSTNWIDPVIKYISLKNKDKKSLEQAVADSIKDVEKLKGKAE